MIFQIREIVKPVSRYSLPATLIIGPSSAPSLAFGVAAVDDLGGGMR